jgi:O-antigen/teichoic acid export membrane protein
MSRSYLNIGKYGIAAILNATFSFFSVPLLIRILGAEEFGRWSLLEPAVMVLSHVALLGLNYSIIQLISQDRFPPFSTFKGLINRSKLVIFLVSLFSSVGLAISGWLWSEALWFTLLVIAEAVLVLLLSTFRAAEEVIGYGVSWVSKASLFFVILLFAISERWIHINTAMSVISWRLIVAMGSIIIGLCSVRLSSGLTFFKGYASETQSRDYYREAIRYGFPLLVASLLAMVIDFAGRYILKGYSDYSSVAYYVVYLKIGAFFGPLIMVPFGLWFPTERFRRMEDPDGGKIFFRRVAVYALTGYLIIGGSIWFFSPWLLSWFAPKVPFDPYTILTLIWSAVFMGMGAPLNVGLLNVGKTHLNIYPVLLSAAIYILLSLILIPHFNITGAALALAFGYLIYTLLICLFSQRAYHVPFAYFKMFFLMGVAFVAMVVINNLILNDRFLICLLKTCLFLIIYFCSAIAIDRKAILDLWAAVMRHES